MVAMELSQSSLVKVARESDVNLLSFYGDRKISLESHNRRDTQT